MRIENPLELTTIPRMTEYGLKEDTTLAQWIPFTSDKEFVITKDKIVVISLATVELAHFYEVVLSKLQNDNQRVRPVLTPEAIDRILDIADEMDNMEFMRDDEPHDMIGGYTIQSKKLH
jgi:predicted transcriptional regulator YheO